MRSQSAVTAAVVGSYVRSITASPQELAKTLVVHASATAKPEMSVVQRQQRRIFVRVLHEIWPTL